MCGLEMMPKRYECGEKECAYATNKMSNLNRHKKRHSSPAHGQSSSTVSSNISDGEWKRSDPGQLSDIVGGVTGSEMESDSDFEGPAPKNAAQPEKSCDVKNKSVGSTDKAAPKTVATEEPPTKKARVDPPTSLEQGRVVRKATDPLPVSAPSKSGATTVQKPVITRPEVSRPPCTYMPPLIPLGPLQRIAHRASVRKEDSACQTDPTKRRVTWTTTKWTENGKEIETVEMVEEVVFDDL